MRTWLPVAFGLFLAFVAGGSVFEVLLLGVPLICTASIVVQVDPPLISITSGDDELLIAVEAGPEIITVECL